MAKKKLKPVTSKPTPISPKELKFWLMGILEFQSDDWVPNEQQWANIKDKIFNLTEEKIEKIEKIEGTERFNANVKEQPNIRQTLMTSYPEGMNANYNHDAFSNGGATQDVAGNFPSNNGISTLLPTTEENTTQYPHAIKEHDKSFL